MYKDVLSNHLTPVFSLFFTLPCAFQSVERNPEFSSCLLSNFPPALPLLVDDLVCSL